MWSWLNRHRKKLIVLILVFLLADGAKSYQLAKSRVRQIKGENLRLTSIMFFGVWDVGFTLDAWHGGVKVSYRISPLFPIVLSEQKCK